VAILFDDVTGRHRLLYKIDKVLSIFTEAWLISFRHFVGWQNIERCI
jgi:hypothetical protein